MEVIGGRVVELAVGEVFVFGSNLAGRHGAGAALDAVRRFGAPYGKGVGRISSKTYAIPTKDEQLNVLPLTEIADHVAAFLGHALDNPRNVFLVTRIGCGLAGYKDEQVAPLFKGAPGNVVFLDARWPRLNSAPSSAEVR